MAGVVVGGDRPRVGLGGDVREIQIAVRIVLDQQQVPSTYPVEQLTPLLETEQRAGGILKIRDDIDTLDPASRRHECRCRLLEIVKIDSVVRLTNTDE